MADDLPVVVVADSDRVMSLFDRAFEGGGANPEALTQLVALRAQIQKARGEQAYAAALARFQDECPPITKDKSHSHLLESGTKRPVRYASFEGMLEEMRPHLRANGFTVKFDGSTDGDMLEVTCTLVHVAGHRETSTFKLPTKSKSPAMSEQHAYSAARSFAKRVTLADVTGITYTDEETEDIDPTTITAEQAANLIALCDEVGQDKTKFLAWQGVDGFAAILARRLPRAIQALEGKRKKPA